MSGNVTVTVADTAVNYAGTAMSSSYSYSDKVKKEPKSISAEDIELEYNSDAALMVQVNAPEAGANLAITAVSSSPSIVSVADGSVITDSAGRANIMLKGELPGESVITISADGTELSVSVTAKVVFVSESMTDYDVEIAYKKTPAPENEYIAALYDENGVMLDCKIGHPSGAATDIAAFRISKSVKERIKEVKTFVWESTGEMKPVEESTCIKLDDFR
ncbi:MAG: hypothetical protein ACI4EA_01745 [Candidatus Ornithomonoglobus sp.]